MSIFMKYYFIKNYIYINIKIVKYNWIYKNDIVKIKLKITITLINKFKYSLNKNKYLYLSKFLKVY